MMGACSWGNVTEPEAPGAMQNQGAQQIECVHRRRLLTAPAALLLSKLPQNLNEV